MFKSISDSGSYRVRLLDVTGQPYDENNTVRMTLSEGVTRLEAGAAGYDQMEIKDRNFYL